MILSKCIKGVLQPCKLLAQKIRPAENLGAWEHAPRQFFPGRQFFPLAGSFQLTDHN